MRRGGWRRAVVFVALLGAVGLFGSGCAAEDTGGVDQQAFEEAFNAATEEYQSEVAAVRTRGGAVSKTDPKQVAGVFDELRGVAESTRARYEQLDAPPDLERPHEALLTNLEKQGEALDRIAAATRVGTSDSGALKDLADLLGEFAATQQLVAQRLAQDN